MSRVCMPSTESQGTIKWEVVIYRSEEDETFTAEAPERPECIEQGATQESALGSARDAIRIWIDTAKELGEPSNFLEPGAWNATYATGRPLTLQCGR